MTASASEPGLVPERWALRPHPAAARELLDALLDPGSFVELDRFMVEAGVVAGVGSVDGRPLAVHLTHLAASGSGLDEVAAEKIVKVQETALRSRVPLVAIHVSPGSALDGDAARLAAAARVLAGRAEASGVIPQVTMLDGPGSRFEAWSSALSDLVLAVGGGPETASADLCLDSEAACLEAIRRILGLLPSSSAELPPARPQPPGAAGSDFELPAPAAGGDVRLMIARLLDGGRHLELRAGTAPGMVTTLGRLGGQVIGVVANQSPPAGEGVAGPEAAKAARFVRFCDAFNVPLLTLVDAGGRAADAAAVQAGARLMAAYVEATVPKLAVLTRRAAGEAYLAMSPKPAGCDLVLAWPGAEVGLGADPDDPPGPYAAAERGQVDAVIEPRETRRELIKGLHLCLGKIVERPARKHGSLVY